MIKFEVGAQVGRGCSLWFSLGMTESCLPLCLTLIQHWGSARPEFWQLRSFEMDGWLATRGASIYDVLINSTKFTQPPLLHLLLGQPPLPPSVRTSYMDAPKRKRTSAALLSCGPSVYPFNLLTWATLSVPTYLSLSFPLTAFGATQFGWVWTFYIELLWNDNAQLLWCLICH